MLHSNLKERGFRPAFRSQIVNVCPGCGHSQWYVGREMAECAFCATALPIVDSRPIMLTDDFGAALG